MEPTYAGGQQYQRRLWQGRGSPAIIWEMGTETLQRTRVEYVVCSNEDTTSSSLDGDVN